MLEQAKVSFQEDNFKPTSFKVGSLSLEVRFGKALCQKTPKTAIILSNGEKEVYITAETLKFILSNFCEAQGGEILRSDLVSQLPSIHAETYTPEEHLDTAIREHLRPQLEPIGVDVLRKRFRTVKATDVSYRLVDYIIPKEMQNFVPEGQTAKAIATTLQKYAPNSANTEKVTKPYLASATLEEAIREGAKKREEVRLTKVTLLDIAKNGVSTETKSALAYLVQIFPKQDLKVALGDLSEENAITFLAVRFTINLAELLGKIKGRKLTNENDIDAVRNFLYILKNEGISSANELKVLIFGKLGIPLPSNKEEVSDLST